MQNPPAPACQGPSGCGGKLCNLLLAYLSICRCQLCIPVVQLIFQLQVADQQSGIWDLLTRPREQILELLLLNPQTPGLP